MCRVMCCDAVTYGNERKGLAGSAESVTEVACVRRVLGVGNLVGRVGVAEIARVETRLCLSVLHAIPLLLLSGLGTKVILKAVECRLRQEDLKQTS